MAGKGPNGSKCRVVLNGAVNGSMGNCGGLAAVGISNAIKSLPVVMPVAAGIAIGTAVAGVSGALVVIMGPGLAGPKVLTGGASTSRSWTTQPALVHTNIWPLLSTVLIFNGVSSVIMLEIHVSVAPIIRVAPTTSPQWARASI